MAAIEVNGLSKTFEYYRKETGMRSSVKNLFHREKLYKRAVNTLDFTIEKGEIVGMLGPNGAGKTTTIKLLSGIIFPTAGSADVLGYVPWERRTAYKKRMAAVMAQKQQLWMDLPANESILLNRYIYDIPEKEYRRNLDELLETFDVRHLMSVQVRRLSLGERMKFEIIASLIHMPEVIFLDEPTIGLDLAAQSEMRKMIRRYNESRKATIILTSHYMKDVEDLCKRVIIISQGEKVYDGRLSDIRDSEKRTLVFRLDRVISDPGVYAAFGILTQGKDGTYRLETSKEAVQPFLAKLIGSYHLLDFAMEEEEIEQKVIDIYNRVRSDVL